MNQFTIRQADSNDVSTILSFIKELAEYENMSDQVVATEELLKEWLFEKKKAEVLLAMEGDTAVGIALYFYNFSTFLESAGC